MTTNTKPATGTSGAGQQSDSTEMHDKDTGVPTITGSLNDKINDGLFLVRTANECINDAKERPIPKRLMGDFWYEGELGILFADTNLGKSIVAVQVGDAISKGEKINGFPMEGEAQIVLYADFELNDKQFEARYSQEFKNHYGFNDNFHRAEINPDAVIPEAYKGDFERFLYDSLEQSIKSTEAKVLILDNITYLKNATETAKDALPLMKYLKQLKSKFKLSILALAHTPKRDLSKPITRNDLMGSKMLINFCDSCFAIGESHNDTSARYLKQIKARNCEIKYDADNVMLCQISKPKNFLQFEFIDFAKERDHLRIQAENDRESIIKKVKELTAGGYTQRGISEELKISLGTVNKYLKTAQEPKQKP